MKHLTKIFFCLIVVCVAAIGYFIYSDYIKKNPTIPKPPMVVNRADTVYKNDGKIHIVIDAGHGGRDIGAPAKNKLKQWVYEKNVARSVVDYMMQMIDTTRYNVIETRIADSMTHRHERMKVAKAFKPQLLVSVHCNSFTNKTWNGTEIHICDSTKNTFDTTSVYNPFYKINKGFSDTLLTNISNAFPKIKKNKVVTRKDRIWMIYAADFPSVLVEWGYLSNANDIEIMTKPAAQETLAKVLWNSIDKHFGFEKK